MCGGVWAGADSSGTKRAPNAQQRKANWFVSLFSCCTDCQVASSRQRGEHSKGRLAWGLGFRVRVRVRVRVEVTHVRVFLNQSSVDETQQFGKLGFCLCTCAGLIVLFLSSIPFSPACALHGKQGEFAWINQFPPAHDVHLRQAGAWDLSFFPVHSRDGDDAVKSLIPTWSYLCTPAGQGQEEPEKRSPYRMTGWLGRTFRSRKTMT